MIVSKRPAPRLDLHLCAHELAPIPLRPEEYRAARQMILAVLRRMMSIWMRYLPEDEREHPISLDTPACSFEYLPEAELMGAVQLFLIIEARPELAALFVEHIELVQISPEFSNSLIRIKGRTLTIFKTAIDFTDADDVLSAIVPAFGQLWIERSPAATVSEFESFLDRNADRIRTARREFSYVVCGEAECRPFHSVAHFRGYTGRKRMELIQLHVERLKFIYEDWLMGGQ